MRVILSGGGTAGHINPALAIANYIKKQDSDAEILFIGTETGMEKKLVTREGYPMKFIDVSGFNRKISFETVKVLFKALSAYRDSKKIIKEFKPDMVIGTGGYVCAPVMFAAVKYKIPSLIHEQNVYPGLTVRMLADKVDITAISFEDTVSYLKKAKRVEIVGNPIRESILCAKQKEGGEPSVLISGGSLGAASINNALLELLKMDGQDYYGITASVGERNYDAFIEKIKKENIKICSNKKILPYIYNMDEELAAADVAITRAGAITVSELCAIGKPAIVIPSPNVVNNHQLYNAKFMEKKGAAVVITEDELSGEMLARQIGTLLSGKDVLTRMSKAGKEAGVLGACKSIYDMMTALIRK